jgi:hypothetical protein
MRVANWRPFIPGITRSIKAKVDGSDLSKGVERDGSIMGFDDAVIHRLERVDGEFPDIGVIVDNKNGGGFAVMRNRVFFTDNARQRFSASRQEYRNRRTVSEARVDANLTARLLGKAHDLAHIRGPESPSP